MPFILPTFNLTCDVYSNAGNFSNPPRATFDCQLRAPNMNALFATGGSVSTAATIVLLLPPGTDIRDTFCTPINAPDWVDVPAGSGCHYQVMYVNDVGKGFPNEHRYALLAKTIFINGWPVPIP